MLYLKIIIFFKIASDNVLFFRVLRCFCIFPTLYRYMNKFFEIIFISFFKLNLTCFINYHSIAYFTSMSLVLRKINSRQQFV